MESVLREQRVMAEGHSSKIETPSEVAQSLANKDDTGGKDQQSEQSSEQDSQSEEIVGPVPGTNVAEKLSFITSHKLAGNRPVYVTTGGNPNGPGGIVRPATASSSASSASQAKWVQPSGPRLPGQGTENEEQGIIAAEPQPEGGVVLRITLLAAGFIIGPAGATVREIMRITGCDIKSWTDSTGRTGKTAATRRPCRVFILEGEDEAVAAGIDIITAAVDRYKELCEGRCQGQSVNRLQIVMGVEFTYQPPPRNVVPFAASLKSNVAPRPSEPLIKGSGRSYNSMMQMLPGYILPMGGGFMPPGSPGSMPYPMFMPGMAASYGYGGDTDASTDATEMYGSAASAMDPLHGGSSSASDATSANAAAAAAAPWAALGNPYTYPPGVDPSAMMAYMSIVMPTSPAAPKYPGDVSGYAMPFSMPASPMTTLAAALPGYMTAGKAAADNTSPPGHPYLMPAGASGNAGSLGSEDPGSHHAASKQGSNTDTASKVASVEVVVNPYLDPASGLPMGSALTGPMSLGVTPLPGYAAGMPAISCWYPPSPAAMPPPALHMPGYGGMPPPSGGNGQGSRRGTGALGSPGRHQAGQKMSPRRLNPSAPTYTPGGSRSTSDSGHGSAFTRGVPDHSDPYRTGQYHPTDLSRQDVRSNHFGGGDAGGYGSFLGYGKTPKRPTTLHGPQAGRGGPQGGHGGYHSAGGESGVTSEHAGRVSTSQPDPSGGSGPPGAYVPDTPALVSSEDPLISPSRFGRRDKNRSSTDSDRTSGPGSLPPPPPPPPAALPHLPALVEKMSL